MSDLSQFGGLGELGRWLSLIYNLMIFEARDETEFFTVNRIPYNEVVTLQGPQDFRHIAVVPWQNVEFKDAGLVLKPALSVT
jgi:hypothetical protein